MSGTDELTEFKLGENIPSEERNVCQMLKVIRSNRPEIEIWAIFDLYTEKIIPENVV